MIMKRSFEKRLVRVLSTGRSGTKFLSVLLEQQGVFSSHEDVYYGEPSEAVRSYLNYLGDFWMESPENYYGLESGFAFPYINAVKKSLETGIIQKKRMASSRAPFFLMSRFNTGKHDLLVDCHNILMPATALVDREARDHGIDIRYLILARNPIKTVHAMFMIESGSIFARRPETFRREQTGELGAAHIWANCYKMILDFRSKLGDERFRLVILEDLVADADDAQGLLGFIGAPFYREKYEMLTSTVAKQPLRLKKGEDVRNSDLYFNRDFHFSRETADAVAKVVGPVSRELGIDPEKAVSDYFDFHLRKKIDLGFANAD